MKITINHNGFHGYTSRTISLSGKPGELVTLSESQAKKLNRAGCGHSDCTCGESLLAACEPIETSDPSEPRQIHIPTEGCEINVRGNYPRS